MSVSITTQSVARKVLLRSAICYLCGDPLPLYEIEAEFSRTSPLVNKDHVVTEKLFEPSDRANFPLLLRTHARCNTGESAIDQKVAELFRLVWNPRLEADLERLELEWNTDATGRATSSIWKGENLEAMVFRWIRGFHFALYDEFIPANVPRATLLPFLRLDGGMEQDTAQFVDMARQIERQRKTDRLDRITAYNGRLRYECFWFLDAVRPTCVYALDVNGWSIFSGLSDDVHRSGVGCYVSRHVPTNASVSTRLVFPSDSCSLDLFPELRERYMRGGREQVMKTVTFRGKPYTR